jgi:hypothetical protein
MGRFHMDALHEQIVRESTIWRVICRLRHDVSIGAVAKVARFPSLAVDLALLTLSSTSQKGPIPNMVIEHGRLEMSK